MAAVTLHGVTKQFGTQIVLESISLELQTGETVGLVGANGSGKTTLFQLITGECEPDYGTVTRARGLEIGLLRQEHDFDPSRTVHDEVGRAFAELLSLEQNLHAISEKMSLATDTPELPELMHEYELVNSQFIVRGGHRFETQLNEILGGVGFSLADRALPIAVLSGGQKCRVALAKLLLEDKTLLLLDEPTNHLDIDAVRWLEKFLAGHHGGAVIISHDRYLLDRLCMRIIEVANRKVTGFSGNYSTYAQTKEVQALTRERQYEKDSEFIRKERDFIARHLAGQRSNEAKGRRTRLERRLAAGEFVNDRPESRRKAKFDFAERDEGAGTILRGDELSLDFGRGPLFQNLSFQVRAGERLGITGPNGTGKTTLLRIILRELDPTTGSVTLAPKQTIGYFAQDRGELNPDRTILEEIRTVRPDFSEQDARSLLGRFLFSGNDVFKTLGVISGGEQSRVRLASLILQQPQLLILDEPTNHLDIPSREALEDALLEFPGTILVVSHDRYFIDRTVDRLLVLRPEGHQIHTGNYSSYVEEWERRRTEERKRRVGPKRRAAAAASIPGKAKAAASRFDRMSIHDLERLLMEQEAKVEAARQRFADPEVYRNAELLTLLRSEAEAMETELAEIDAAWQERVKGMD